MLKLATALQWVVYSFRWISDILEAVKRGTERGAPPFHPVIEDGACSEELRTSVMRCFSLDPAKRPGLGDLRKTLREQGKILYMSRLEPVTCWFIIVTTKLCVKRLPRNVVFYLLQLLDMLVCGTGAWQTTRVYSTPCCFKWKNSRPGYKPLSTKRVAIFWKRRCGATPSYTEFCHGKKF